MNRNWLALGASVFSLTAVATDVPSPRGFCDSGKLAKGAEIAVFRGCLGCHTVTTKRIGPAYMDIANKYPYSPETIAKLAKKIKEGGKGNWGDLAMPANPVSDEEAAILADWVLSLKEVVATR